MTDKNKSNKPAHETFVVETAQQRRVKYGANVALSVVIVLVLTALLVYCAGRVGWRRDTTAAGTYSLKPQTVTLIKNLPQKVEIVGLFTKAKQQQEKREREDDPAVRYQQIADLLQEYQEKSDGKVTVRMIDRITEPDKVDDLFKKVARQYGNDFKKYEDVMNGYGGTLDQILKVANEEIDALKKNPPKVTDQKMARVVGEIAITVQLFPASLKQLREDVKSQLELKVPDYMGAAAAIRKSLDDLTEQINAVQEKFGQAKKDPSTPAEFKAYVAAAEPRYAKMKEVAGELLKKIGALGEMKQLDALRQTKNDSVVVLGQSDLKVIPSDSLYVVDRPGRMGGDADGRQKPRFAAEQQLTRSIVSLTTKDKKRIVFVRSGGEPAAMSLPMFRFTGQYADLADRLREYGMEVLEKDVSGQWQMQAMQLQMQMQGMPLPPEATDEQMKGATWIVMVTPQDPRQMMQNPAGNMLGPKLNEHLKSGGSALVMVDPQAERLDFLKEWGIETKPEYLVIHDRIEGKGARAEDVTQEWMRQQPVFVLNNYGDHAVTRPLQSLDGLFVPVIPVSTVEAKGVKTTPILPLPNDPKTWGESDLETIRSGKATFSTAGDKPDLAGPFFGGAIAEKDGGKGRLIVIGNRTFALDEYQQIPDVPASRQQGRPVARFPGNSELIANSVFWLTGMDTMIAVSPTALEIPRVAAISPAGLNFLRVGVLIVGLPLVVLMAGSLVYLKRRD
jgi:hypothetical protein